MYSQQGDYEKAKELLKQGAPTNVKDNAGWTPLVSSSFFQVTISDKAYFEIEIVVLLDLKEMFSFHYYSMRLAIMVLYE